jgi:hypothetical protein
MKSMLMRWKAPLLAPLLALALLAQTAPQVAQAAVTSCTAGGSVTITTVTSEGTVSLVISCTGTQLAGSGIPGGASQTNYWPSPPANASWNGTYCAGSKTGLDSTAWIPVYVTRSLSNTYDLIGLPNGPRGYGSYPYGPYYYTLNSSFSVGNGSTINNIGGSSSSPSWADTSYTLKDIVEVSGDVNGAGSYPDAYEDSTAQREIVSGPVYNRQDLTGATWQNGANPYYTYYTYWGITGYTKTQVLVTAGYWTNMDLLATDWAAGSYTSYYWMDWFGYNRPSIKPTPGATAGAPSAWPAYWKYEINGELSSDGYNFTYPATPAWRAPVYKTVTTANYGWLVGSTYHPGVAPTCRGGQWNAVPYLYSNITIAAMDAVAALTGVYPDLTDIYLWPGAVKISNPPVTGLIPSSWTNLGALKASVTPGTFKQTYGQYNIQVVGAPFPYAMSGQTYIGSPIVKTLTVVTTDPNTGVQFVVTLVSTVGLTGVKWDWGDGTQSLIPGALGLGVCSPQPPTQPWCDPTHTPTHAGNGHVNAWEYYGSDIWEFYWDPTQGGVVSKDLGNGLPAGSYAGCPSDPNPSYRSGGSDFCLTPTPAAPGTPEVVGLTGGYPYSVGQVEGLPGS